MELAFLPRALRRELTPLALAGAPPERILESANELSRPGSWRPGPDVLESQIKAMECTHAGLLLLSDPAYPEPLRHISDPPIALYYRGQAQNPGGTWLAVVGSRKSSGNSISFTKDLARTLSEAGVGIVSGMAAGIDTAAHEGCIEGGGRTVAVLGCGVDVCYPRRNRALMELISQCGMVVSEYPMGTAPQPFHFPERNRIISGWCDGTLVVEAGRQSGALITARLASDQGRTVLAVPGAVWNPLSWGSNALIRDGAVPVRGPEDILDELVGILPRGKGSRSDPGAPLKDSELAVLEALDYDLPMHVDAVAEITRYPVSSVLPILLGLEMRGMAGQFPGKRFIRVAKGD